MGAGYSDIQKQIRLYGPSYLWRVAGLALALLILIVGYAAGRASIAAIGAALVVAFALLLAVTAWSLQLAGDNTELRTVQFLYQLSQTRPSDSLACVDLGLRWPAITIGEHLTSGRMVIFDIYNPQLMPSASLVRARQLAPSPFADPRLVWYDSALELLPLPDNSVSALFLYFVLSELAQRGDQKLLLGEIRRVLEPNGRLLVAEMADTWPNRIRPGGGITRIRSREHWSDLLSEAGFELRRLQTLDRVTLCLRADKPSPYSGRQMKLELDFEAG